MTEQYAEGRTARLLDVRLAAQFLLIAESTLYGCGMNAVAGNRGTTRAGGDGDVFKFGPSGT